MSVVTIDDFEEFIGSLHACDAVTLHMVIQPEEDFNGSKVLTEFGLSLGVDRCVLVGQSLAEPRKANIANIAWVTEYFHISKRSWNACKCRYDRIVMGHLVLFANDEVN